MLKGQSLVVLMTTATEIAKIFSDKPSMEQVVGVSDELTKFLDKVAEVKPEEEEVVEVEEEVIPITDGTPFRYGPIEGVRVPIADPTIPWSYVDSTGYWRVYDMWEVYSVFQRTLRDKDWTVAQLIWDQVPLANKQDLCDGSTADLATNDPEVGDWFRKHGVKPRTGPTLEETKTYYRQFNPNLV